MNFLFSSIDKLAALFCNLLKSKVDVSHTSSRTPSSLNHIAVIKLSALGDLLCLLPSLKTFKHFYPDISITLITTRRSSPQFFRQLSFVDNVLVLDCFSVFKLRAF